jgi:glycerate dehydrogenase
MVIKMKLVFTDAGTVTQGDLSLDCLRSYGDLILYDENTEGEEQLLRIEEADALFCNKTKIGRKEIDRAKNLRYIGLFATGYNNIDIAYAKEKGITVCNAGQYSTKAVAQQTFALLLELVCQTGKYHRFVEDGGWQKSRFL